MASSTEVRHCTSLNCPAPDQQQLRPPGLPMGLASSPLLAVAMPFDLEVSSRSRPSPLLASSSLPPSASAASALAVGASILVLRGAVAFPISPPAFSLALIAQMPVGPPLLHRLWW